MASAQVMPNSAVASSRKKGHLEAGKKRLEEFRKKKAEGRAKKAASTGQLQSADVDQHENFSQNYEHVRDGSTSTSDSTSVTNPVMAHEVKAISSSQSTDIGSSSDMHATSLALVNNDNTLCGDIVQDAGKDEASKFYESSVSSNLLNGYYAPWREDSELSHNRDSNSGPNGGISSDGFNASDVGDSNPNIGGNFNYSSFHFESQSSESRNFSKINDNNHDKFSAYIMSTPEGSGDFPVQKRLGFPGTSASISGINGEKPAGVEQYISGSMDHESALGGREIIDSASLRINADGARRHALEPSSTDLSFLDKPSSNQQPFPSNDYGTSSGRSRPSFLESLGLPRNSSTTHKSYYEPQKASPPLSFANSKFHSTKINSSSTADHQFSEANSLEQSHKSRTTSDFVTEKDLSVNSSGFSNDSQHPKLAVSDHLHRDQDLPGHNKDPSHNKDDNFAALEQYIEDLTQEKFSLQRALETSRSLAESLASENSSLTESYNQQGQVVNQLKFDMERLQEEIKAQLLALESFKVEYTNAQLECNAADERAKILASEVISLEEKALRLRSNELKLEKQLENSNSEISSFKRKVSILEKERQDFQSTIDALQEEKKLLQSKLRKAPTNANVSDTMLTSTIKKDASTATEELGEEHMGNGETSIAEIMHQNALQDVGTSVALSSNSSIFSLLPEDRRIYLPDDSGVIPIDQQRMIDNINSLISELALEKEELMQALSIESSNSSKLKDLNKDLSQKLEAQTQRLELLTAQRMANKNVLAKPIDIHSMQDTTDTTVYADEGDEVVERVLGWIMKLFPGGTAKRRTSKLL